MDQPSDHSALREALQERLGFTFEDAALLELALTHRSWKEEHGGGDNERLEFLGDAVVELLVTEHLVARYPETPEGILSRMRARLVCTTSLADLGRAWNVGVALQLGRGEAASGGADKDSLLANAVEAVLGAIYSDGGLEACRKVLEPQLERVLASVQDPSGFGVDPKSALQELTMAQWKVMPRYAVIATDGPPHARRFQVKVTVGKLVTASGWGTSKQDAQREAASVALVSLRAQISSGE